MFSLVEMIVLKALKFDFGCLTVLDHVIVGEICEGQTVEMNVALKVVEVAHEYFNGEPWAYISNRKSQYSLNPMIYKTSSIIEDNLRAFAVVSYSPISKKVAEIERGFKFESYEFDIFETLSEAIDWARACLAKLPVASRVGPG